jgi:RES domain-containing protein
MRLTLEIPPEILQSLKVPQQEVEERLRLELALALYSQNLLPSTGSARSGTALDGEGARINGGRWSYSGNAVVYASESLSLAALELLAHVDADLLPDDLVWIGIEVPGGLKVEEVRPEDLPAGRNRYPAPERLQRIGSTWAKSSRSAILSVPSAIIPQERNFLLLPRHPDFCRLKISRPKPFRLDVRLLN